MLATHIGKIAKIEKVMLFYTPLFTITGRQKKNNIKKEN